MELLKFIIILIILPLLGGLGIITLNIQIPLINNLAGEMQLLILVILFDLVVFLLCVLLVSPPEIHNEQERIIKELKDNFVFPKLEFSVMRIGYSIKNTKTYASISVKNTEEFEIESFYGVITSFAYQKLNFGWEEFIDSINPDGSHVSVNGRTDNEIISLGRKGGKARFNIVKEDDQGIVVLNQNTPKKIENGAEFKITVTFNGKCQGKFINPVNKIYRLSCAYKNQTKKTGITIIEFKESGGVE